ncbi:S8 family peptidase [Cytobacillus sp. IB215665]|uniref:S8 family peptidase n=1 Tax=Cytobacillus sp. IB215665 TaxID=3097357 RepID=UPI002A0FF824|nr:S8 family serine peptidase [Cytobacillus sp. IB215665]MDX8364889.1 S8 family serine peptidase [Cytobacillus sp. IB215665]
MKKLISLFFTALLIVGVALPTSASTKSEESISYTIVFKKEQLPNDVSSIVEELGGTIVKSIPEIGVIQVKAPTDFAKDAIKHADISVATPSLVVNVPDLHSIDIEDTSIDVNNASLYDLQWDIKRVTNDGASYDINTGNHDVVVGIIDSGIDVNHPDVKENLLPGSKNFVPAGGITGVDKSETGDLYDIQDRNGHGTHVAGTIAGNGEILGVAPNVGFRSYRVFAAEGGAHDAWIVEAIIAAANDGVDVINMSLGGIMAKGQVYFTDPETGERTKLGDDVAEFVAYSRAMKYAEKKGALVVTSAGNDGINATNHKEVTELANLKYGPDGYEYIGASFYAPASIPNVVSVSATGPFDELALYSNYGNGFVDVAAPGGNYELYMEYLNAGIFDEYIANRLFEGEFNLSSVPDVSYEYDAEGVIVDYTYNGPSYAWQVGTSMAAPKVSAVAALIYATNDDITPKKVKLHLQKSAEDIGGNGHDESFGKGLVNAYYALTR